MNKHRKLLPKQTSSVLIILLLFVVISFVYFPACLENKVLDASDYNTYSGASKELRDFRESTGKEALWTNSMFGGMPAYLILTNYTGNIFQPYFNLLSHIPKPVNYLLVNFCLFFLLGLILGINRWISFAGALAYGLSTYFFIMMGEGHVTKVQAISYFSVLIAGVYLAYRGKRFWGSFMAAVGLSLILSVNHPQMSYYIGILVLIMVATYLISAIKEKTLPDFLKTSATLAGAVLIAVGICFGPILTTYKYGKYSTRGKPNVAIKDNNQATGLDKDYILDYSYNLGEAITSFIPRFRGGSITEPLGKNTETYKLLVADQGKQQADKIAKSSPVYWGCQPISKGPFYYGAGFWFLFVLGLFIVKGREKWWIAAVVFFSFLLSLGKNIPFLADFMVGYFPGYNKFRAVTNIVVIQHFAMAIMGLLAVREIYLRNIESKKFIKFLKYSFAIVGGFALIFVIIPGLAGNFRSDADADLVKMGGWPVKFIEAIVADRKSMVRADAFRTLVFISLAATVIWAFWAKKIKTTHALLLWILLIFADMWPVDKRYLNNDSFVSAKRAEVTFQPTEADKFILSDKDPDYRVLNLSLDPFTDASTSYYHKSVGGNNGAKLRRYHEMIYFNISREIQVIIKNLEGIKTESSLDSLLASLNSINLMNTRYIIFNPDADPIVNKYAIGNAWFVDSCRVVPVADEEVRSIKNLTIKTTAVLDKSQEKFIPRKSYIPSGSAIKLKSYAPNKLVYEANCLSEQLAVFSEIYYPEGWVARIDGKESPHFRADYILRAMVVPGGKHEIVFEFKPQVYKTGNMVSLASSILLVLIFVAGLLFEFRKKEVMSQIKKQE
jgi:hypothetical protein